MKKIQIITTIDVYGTFLCTGYYPVQLIVTDRKYNTDLDDPMSDYYKTTEEHFRNLVSCLFLMGWPFMIGGMGEIEETILEALPQEKEIERHSPGIN